MTGMKSKAEAKREREKEERIAQSYNVDTKVLRGPPANINFGRTPTEAFPETQPLFTTASRHARYNYDPGERADQVRLSAARVSQYQRSKSRSCWRIRRRRTPARAVNMTDRVIQKSKSSSGGIVTVACVRRCCKSPQGVERRAASVALVGLGARVEGRPPGARPATRPRPSRP
jgi:hypothetical protein